MSSPRAWLFSDSLYAGGAERYLELLLHAAGPARLGIVAVEHPGLVPWLHARQGEGFVVDGLPPRPLVRAWLDWWRWARARRPHLVHVNMPGPYDGLMATAPWIAKRAGVVRVVVTEHLPGVGRVGRRYWWKRALLGGIDRAIVVCEAHRDVMVRTFGYDDARVSAIHNGIDDPARVRPRGADRGPLPRDLVAQERVAGLRLLQLGSLDARKGPHRLIRAFSEARRRGLRASLWFVGEGPARAELRELVRELGLESSVVFTGHRDDVHDLLRAADVVVLASEREGLPFSLIEAAAWARPMLATDVDGVAEIVLPGRVGRLVALHRPEELVAGLVEIGQDAQLRARWGDAARAHFESNLGSERMLERTFALYPPEVRP